MLRRRLVAAVLAAAQILAVAPSAWARDKKSDAKGSDKAAGARVEGRIVGPDGKTPVAGAVVRVYPLEGDQTFAAAPSDSKGRFSVAGLPFGYADVAVEVNGGAFAGTQVVSLPPGGRVGLVFTLVTQADRSAEWWQGRTPRTIPGVSEAKGAAEIGQELHGKDYWKSGKGIAIIAGIGGAVLLAIAAGSGGYSSQSTP